MDAVRRALPVLLLFVQFLSVSSHAHGRCLPSEAASKGIIIPRRRIKFGSSGGASSVSLPIRIESNSWTTHQLQARLMGILHEEVYGFEVEYVEGVSSSHSTGKMSGCPQYVPGEPFVPCSGEERGPPMSMINMELWHASIDKAAHEAAVEDGTVGEGGRVSFTTKNGIYVNRALVDRAWSAAGEVADHWRGWMSNYTVKTVPSLGSDSTWNKIGLEHCPPSNQTGCSAQGFFAAGTCRDNPSECGTLIAAYPYYSPGTLPQMISNLNLSVGIQWLGDKQQEVIRDRLRRDEPTLFYYWTPDILHSQISRDKGHSGSAYLNEVVFPPHDSEQYALNDESNFGPVASAYDESYVEKVYWLDMISAHRPTVITLKRYQLRNQDISSLLDYYVDELESGESDSKAQDEKLHDAACRWLQANEEQWLTWIACKADNKGFDFATNACVQCPIGFKIARNASRPPSHPEECMPCEAEDDCNICKPGHGGSIGSDDCKPCPAGSFSADQKGVCAPCPVDQFSASGSLGCTECSILGEYYQDAPGQDTCKLCPENTELYFPSRHGVVAEGPDSDFCVCRVGFWRPDGAYNAACMPCQEGAYCPGGLAPPEPTQGYWSLYNEQNGSQVLAGYPHECGDQTCRSVPDFTFACSSGDSCLGGIGANCSKGWQGTTCTHCDTGYFMVNMECEKCPDKPWDTIMSLAAFLGVIAVWNAMNVVTAGSHDSADIGLQYVQYVATVQTFSIPWHQSLTLLATVFAIFNFSVDFVSPNCVYAWAPMNSYYVNLGLPLIWLGVSALQAGVAAAWFRLYPRHRSGARDARVLQLLTPGWMVGSSEDLQVYILSRLKSGLNLLIVVYNSLCIATFQGFICQPLPDGNAFLLADPNIMCYDDAGNYSKQYAGRLAMTFVFLVVYVVGIPLGFFLLLRRLRVKNQMYDDQVLDALGWLYTRYEPGLWYWECVILMRRLFLSAAAVFLASRTDIQITVTLLMIMFFIAAQFYYRPFVNSQVDAIDCLGLMSLGIYVLGGSFMVYTVYEKEKEMMAILMYGITIITLIIIAVLFYLEHPAVSVKNWCDSTLARLASEAYVYSCMRLGHKFRTAESMKKSLLSEQSFLPGTTKEGYISSDKLRDVLQEVEDPAYGHQDVHVVYELMNGKGAKEVSVEMLAGEVFFLGNLVQTRDEASGAGFLPSLHADVEYALEHMAGNRMPKEHRRLVTQRTIIPRAASRGHMVDSGLVKEIRARQDFIRDEGGEISYTLIHSVFGPWLKKMIAEEKWDSVFRAIRLDRSLAVAVADNSAIGAFSYSPAAVTFRHFIASHPQALTWALSATSEGLTGFRMLMEALVSVAEEGAEGKVGVAEVVEATDRGPLLHWLLNGASDEERSLCNDVLQEISDFHHERKVAARKSNPFRRLYDSALSSNAISPDCGDDDREEPATPQRKKTVMPDMIREFGGSELDEYDSDSGDGEMPRRLITMAKSRRRTASSPAKRRQTRRNVMKRRNDDELYIVFQVLSAAKALKKPHQSMLRAGDDAA